MVPAWDLRANRLRRGHLQPVALRRLRRQLHPVPERILLRPRRRAAQALRQRQLSARDWPADVLGVPSRPLLPCRRQRAAESSPPPHATTPPSSTRSAPHPHPPNARTHDGDEYLAPPTQQGRRTGRGAVPTSHVAPASRGAFSGVTTHESPPTSQLLTERCTLPTCHPASVARPRMSNETEVKTNFSRIK